MHEAPGVVARPEVVKDEHLDFLDDLRDSGTTNMFGARPYLLAAFPELKRDEGMKVLQYWMDSFSERHPSD